MPKIHEKQMSVGEVIAKLRSCKEDADVYFDFCGTKPTGTASYRGYYEDLAIDWTDREAIGLKCGQLLQCFEQANNKDQSGYKGGWYTVNNDTAVWVANWGECDGTAVISIENDDYRIIIHTAMAD